eukprot:COSAG01_NODE_14111_length_1495_cov_1.188395_1_plen_90_part_00
MRRRLPSSLPTHQLLFVKLLHFMTCLAGASWGRYQGIYLNTQRQLTPLQKLGQEDSGVKQTVQSIIYDIEREAQAEIGRRRVRGSSAAG